MTATHKNRLKTTISAVASSGLGAFTVSTASSGYRTFGAGDDGLTFDGVLIVEGTTWEVRDGCAYTHAGTSLSRGTLKDSSTGSAITFTSAAVVSHGAAAAFADMTQLAMQSVMPGGRLTLESGVPVSTSDQTAKTSIFYTPFVHNVAPLWDGYKWVPVEFSETTLALGTLTSSLPYDVFAYLSSGVLALESLAWTNTTTRATAVTLQDGRYCKSGDKTRLLLGTFYTASTTTTEDSAANRYVSNAYNAVSRPMTKTDATSHSTGAGSVWRAWNAGTAGQVNFVTSVVTGDVAPFAGFVTISSSGGLLGISPLDAATSEGHYVKAPAGDSRLTIAASIPITSVGLHYVTINEFQASHTMTNCALRGSILA